VAIKKISENAKATLTAVKQAYLNEDTELIKRVEALIGTPIELDGALLDAYLKLGDNPLDEPKLYVDKSTYETESDFIFALADIVFDVTKINQEEFTIQDITSFIVKCHNKVNSFRSDDGYIKTTTATENAKMPHFKDIRKIKEIEENRLTRLQGIGNFDPDIDDVAEYLEAINIINKESDKKMMPVIYKITGLKAKDLHVWEKLLIKENILEYMSSGLNAAISRSL